MAASSTMTSTSLTCCSESSSSRRDAPSSSSTSALHHEIFLSHSGVQKAFVKALYKKLNPFYTPFFDIAHHSLPPSENFPKRILEATKACELAVVVLSDEFLLSKWPMIELCAFVKAAPLVKILPVFYKLTPENLKHPKKVKKWHKAWKAHARKDKRIHVPDWVHALGHLSSLNGLVFHPFDQDEEEYLEEIVSCIFKIIPIALQYEDREIHGKDRLCKIILDRFRELDSMTLQPCDTRCLAPHESRVCMLGMHGLPGTGKSTLSRCLCNYFVPCFPGRSFYLELPTNPTLDQLLNKSKELLRNLPGCHNMVNLTSNALDIHQVYYLFKTSSLPGSKVFLVVDSISSEESVDFVQHLLRLGFGAGSKVLLVARTLNVLQPLLQIHQKENHHVCGSISIPSIDEKEAIQILLHSGGGGSRVEAHAQEDGFSPRHRQILEKVVHMSGFGGEHDHRLYLPLVLRIMGNQLRQYEFDIEKWGRETVSFWKKVEVCKEDAVSKLVQQSFESLSKKLQLLFLDIALFVLPSFHTDVNMNGLSMKEAREILSIMHESSPERIEMEMYGLRQCGFVEILYNRQKCVRVHDVYLEFAANNPQSCMYYLSYGRRVWKRGCNEGVGGAPTSCTELSCFSPFIIDQQAKASGLRAIILELDEGQERLEFSASLSSVRALVLRNSKSLTELIGLAGLTSLVSLEIDNCPKLKWVDNNNIATGNYGPQLMLKRLIWAANKQDETMEMPQSRRSSNIWMQAQQLLSARMSGLLSLGKLEPQIKPMFEIGSFASQFRGLQTLTLENTGIKRFQDMSKCWPQLRELRVVEKHLEHFELRSLPKLKRFFFSDMGNEALLDSETDGRFYASTASLIRSRELKRKALAGKDLFAGCPDLEEVRMCSKSFVEAGMGPLLGASKLHTLWLRDFYSSSSFPSLATPLAQSVERLLITDGDVRNVNFAWRFESLRKLELLHCPGLVEVTGLENLPSLCKLDIRGCDKLQTLSGLSGLVGLETFKVRMDCPNLSVSLSELENLAQLRVLRCHSVQYAGFFDVANLVGLSEMCISTGSVYPEGTFVGLERLGKLEQLVLWSSSDENCGILLDLSVLLGVPKPYCHLCGLESIHDLRLGGLQNLVSLKGVEFLVTLETLVLEDLKQLTSLQGMECLVNLQRLHLKGCVSLTSLQGMECLVNLRHLRLEGFPQNVAIGSLNCMEFLATLTSLSLKDLRQITSLQWMECLVNLRRLRLEGCESVNELPSLRALVNMWRLCIRDCGKLKAIQGCDAMTRLERADFDGCTSLASLPLDFESLRRMMALSSNIYSHGVHNASWSSIYNSPGVHIAIAGCKFASVDAMVAWALDENVPVLLREASLKALAWEFDTNLLGVQGVQEKRRERRALGEVLVVRVGAYFLQQIFESDEGQYCLAFAEWANVLEKEWNDYAQECNRSIGEEVKEVVEVLRGLEKVSKQQVLQQCRSDSTFQLSVVDRLAQLAHEYDMRFPRALWARRYKHHIGRFLDRSRPYEHHIGFLGWPLCFGILTRIAACLSTFLRANAGLPSDYVCEDRVESMNFYFYTKRHSWVGIF